MFSYTRAVTPLGLRSGFTSSSGEETASSQEFEPLDYSSSGPADPHAQSGLRDTGWPHGRDSQEEVLLQSALDFPNAQVTFPHTAKPPFIW